MIDTSIRVALPGQRKAPQVAMPRPQNAMQPSVGAVPAPKNVMRPAIPTPQVPHIAPVGGAAQPRPAMQFAQPIAFDLGPKMQAGVPQRAPLQQPFVNQMGAQNMMKQQGPSLANPQGISPANVEYLKRFGLFGAQ